MFKLLYLLLLLSLFALTPDSGGRPHDECAYDTEHQNLKANLNECVHSAVKRSSL